MDELVLQTPEGIYLQSLRQDGQRVMINGYAQSNERVSEFLRNLSNNSPWLERPDLIEIKSVTLGQGRDMKKIFEFTVNVGIKRPRDKEAAAVLAASGPDLSASSGKAAGATSASVPRPSGSAPVASVETVKR
jgi:type IV pilus assembly protein PilN